MVRFRCGETMSKPPRIRTPLGFPEPDFVSAWPVIRLNLRSSRELNVMYDLEGYGRDINPAGTAATFPCCDETDREA